MPYDANTVLQTLVTSITTFRGTGFDLGTQTPRRGMAARFIISNLISATTAGTVFTPIIEESTDNTTFWELSGHSPITGTTAAQKFEKFVRFSTRNRYVRASMVLSATTGAPSVSFLADIGIANP